MINSVEDLRKDQEAKGEHVEAKVFFNKTVSVLCSRTSVDFFFFGILSFVSRVYHF